MDYSSQAMPSMNHSINHSSQEMPQIDHPDVIQRIQGFHRILSDLQNVLCNICKERFPTISTDELGMFRRCLVDSEVPKLFSLISYFVSFLRLTPTCFSICLVLISQSAVKLTESTML